MFERVLVAVDDSDCAKRAAKFGIELANATDASVDMLHVLQGGAFLRNKDAAMRAASEHGEKLLDEVMEFTTGLDVTGERHLIEGKPSKVITDFADDRDADLIVMGRQGIAGLGARLLGSVTGRVLRRADVPVLTIPEGDVEAETGRTYEQILVTTDGSKAAEWSAPFARDIARQYGAPIHILNVVDVQAMAGVFDAGGVSREYIEWCEEQGHEATDRFADRIGETGDDIQSAVVQGMTHTAIQEYIDENDIDLVVMASEGQSNLAGQHLGSVTGRILRTVDVPVLVVTGEQER
ncbi:universal stress protein [Haladaptatus sp. NG-SE-30]